MRKSFTKEKVNLITKKIGPGVITGVSDDDPSGIATYSQAGAAFGLEFLWSALLTYPLMYYIQEMCARIGIICSSGIIGVVYKHYSSFLAWLIIGFIIPPIIFNIAADLASMGAIMNILFPGVSVFIYTVFIVLISLGYMFFCGYKTIANIFKIFCLALLCYFLVPFFVKQDWKAVLYSTFVPQLKWNKEYLLILVAILGTTISPYLFFWQSCMSNEEKKIIPLSTKESLHWMKFDVNLGMLISNLAMYFIILTTGSVLFQNGVKEINTVEDASLALKPLVGEYAFLFFAAGIIGVGFLAIPVLAGCAGFMVSECFKEKAGLDKNLKQAPLFYGIITISMLIALGINFVGIDPIKSLILTAILYGVVTPPIIALILLICNNSKIMGIYKNSLTSNIFGFIIFLLMTFVIVCFLYFEILDFFFKNSLASLSDKI
jgi:NRAMP (natural resistance-associated macrophage protein)-like metal ion transporter